MRWSKLSLRKMHPRQTKTKTRHLSLDRKDDREPAGMCDDEWRPVWVVCCEPEERCIRDKIHEWAGPDHDRPGRPQGEGAFIV